MQYPVRSLNATAQSTVQPMDGETLISRQNMDHHGSNGAGPCFSYSRMRSDGSRFTWGLGVGLCSPKVAFADRNRWQPFATVCGDAVRLSTLASASGVVQKACQVGSRRRMYFVVCRGGVCVSDLWRRNYIGVCGGGVCVTHLWRRSDIRVCRCLCERSVSPQLYWCLQRRCQCE